MNVFSRTFLPAAAESGLTDATINRHLPILRQCVSGDDAVTLLARCSRPGNHRRLDFLLLLTYRRLVITSQSWPLGRLRLHLNSDLRHLHNITWTPDPDTSIVELTATAVDGVRERFQIRTPHPKQVWQLDTVFGQVFRPRATTLAVASAHRRPLAAALPAVA